MPECAGWDGPFWPITPEVAVHEAEPDSKPGLPSFWPAAQVLAAVTVSVNDVVCDPVAAVPVIVIAYVPAGVELEVTMLSDDDEPELTDVGESVAVAPDGAPVALSETVSDEPDVTAVETVAAVLFPATTLAEVGLTEMEKSLEVELWTVNVNVVVCVALAPVAVIVTA